MITYTDLIQFCIFIVALISDLQEKKIAANYRN